ncbi:MAG: hypothetical protein N4A48_05125 [Tepidibacter sp.]|nr:hypothetical protein [Tepidibacter sp.]MCT4508135.1 hypothetical protein [Tepidibacter sp.]
MFLLNPQERTKLLMDKIKELIQDISQARQSNVICYIGGDRKNISTRVAPDIIPIFHKHLEAIKNNSKNDKIDLLLYTKGGDVLTALRLVQLIYEYTDNFSVLIPYKSYSAGTLISLGASEIIMTKMGELSPVDPNVTSIFNPVDPNNSSAKIPISVEDVYSFITLVKDIMDIQSDDSLSSIFSKLVENVHPLALGSIHRTYLLIRSVAKKLLLSHMDISEEVRINEIINHLTEKLFSHNYMITRKEAKEFLKLPVNYCDSDLERDIWNIYEYYKDYLELDKPFIPEKYVDINGRFSAGCGIIESIYRTDEYIFEGVIQRSSSYDGNIADNVNITYQGWKMI